MKHAVQYGLCLSAYVNCKVHLNNPGNLECTQSGFEPMHCDISCDEYEDLEEVPTKRLTCVDETFADSLPHCANMTLGGMYW